MSARKRNAAAGATTQDLIALVEEVQRTPKSAAVGVQFLKGKAAELFGQLYRELSARTEQQELG